MFRITLSSFALVIAAVAGAFGLTSRAPAGASTRPVLISQSVRAYCESSNQTKWTYSHKHDGAYVLYPAAKVTHTASDNYRDHCKQTTSTRTWNGSAVVTVTRTVPIAG